MKGDHRAALDRLMALAYPELKRMAHRRLRAERANHTLNTTALVHEAYLRLGDQATIGGHNQAQFFAIASMAMRRILVDHARRHGSAKRGGDRQRATLEADALATGNTADLVLAVNAALDRLSRVDERLGRVVECRFFAGLTADETATALGVTVRTVERDWAKAKALLYEDLSS